MVSAYVGFVYLWYDRKRKMYYVGSRRGHEDDGYICSAGPRFWNAYEKRPEDFKRRVIERVYGEVADVYEAEQRWLDLIKLEELNVRYYNLKKTASGLDSESAQRIFADPEVRKRMSRRDAWKADPTILEHVAASVQATYDNDPAVKKRVGDAVRAAHVADPTIAQRIVETRRATIAKDPTYEERHGAAIRAANEADPTINQRRGASLSATLARDSTITERRIVSLRATFEADPMILVRRGAAIRAGKARKRAARSAASQPVTLDYYLNYE